VDTRLSLADEFKQAAQQDWGWPVARAPLQTDPADSATIINAWFSSETNGRTTNVVSHADIPPGSGFIGVTVATFVSPWKQAYFERGDTIAEDFHLSAKSKACVSTMKSSATFPYGENEQLQLLRLDYKHEGTALLLLLPKDASRFSETLAAFTSETFVKSVAELRSIQVQLWLPKVRSVSQIDWRTPLGQLGLATAFTPEADFNRISGNKQVPLSLARLVQDVHIQWDEAGTEARSRIEHISWLGMVPEPPRPPVRFIANHPFAYLIFNTTNLDIYFMGVVSEPSQVLTLQ
jgi:serpin B